MQVCQGFVVPPPSCKLPEHVALHLRVAVKCDRRRTESCQPSAGTAHSSLLWGRVQLHLCVCAVGRATPSRHLHRLGAEKQDLMFLVLRNRETVAEVFSWKLSDFATCRVGFGTLAEHRNALRFVEAFRPQHWFWSAGRSFQLRRREGDPAERETWHFTCQDLAVRWQVVHFRKPLLEDPFSVS